MVLFMGRHGATTGGRTGPKFSDIQTPSSASYTRHSALAHKLDGVTGAKLTRSIIENTASDTGFTL